MVVFSFSIIVSFMFISLLLVTDGIVYSKMGSNVNMIVSILFDGENISFEAIHTNYSAVIFLSIFRLVRKIAKSDYWLRYVCLFVCLSAWNNSSPTERIFMKYDRVFFENLSMKNLIFI